MAHGYAKIEGKPMVVLAHGTVGLQHASMAIYNAYCDRVPVYMIARQHRWTRRAAAAASNGRTACRTRRAMVRDFIKWDDLPVSLRPLRRVGGARLQDRDDAADGAGA